jgi:hypothetical protein
MDHLLALRRVHFVDTLDQSQGIFALQCGLFGVDFFSGLNVCLRKKLLRFSTALSPRPMIAPVDF